VGASLDRNGPAACPLLASSRDGLVVIGFGNRCGDHSRKAGSLKRVGSAAGQMLARRPWKTVALPEELQSRKRVAARLPNGALAPRSNAAASGQPWQDAQVVGDSNSAPSTDASVTAEDLDL